ncbi:MAG: hypothetical protein K0Q90_4369, partial [Paenibacillaceae bacterium]|nr:hypothetical protein [Paenibacillaceae bacterium]
MFGSIWDGLKDLFLTPANLMFFVFALLAIGGAIFAMSLTRV